MTEIIRPPVARKIPHEMSIHDHVRCDDYYWMRDDDRKDPDVIEHLNAENDYLKQVMAHTDDFQVKLFDEIVGRIKKDDSSVPVKMRGFWYQSKYDGDNEYPIHQRWRDGTESHEILFDVNQMAEGHEYFNLSGYSVSPDNNIAAFGTDTISRRIYEVGFKDLQSGKPLTDVLVGTSGQAIWAADNNYVFYIKKDPQTLLGKEVYRHKLGTKQSDDILVYEETDESFYTYLSKSRDESVIYIHHHSTTKCGVSMLGADDPMGEFKAFLPLEADHEYEVEKIGTYFYILTNWQAQNSRIMKVHEDDTANKDEWQDVIPHRDEVFIEEYTLFDGYLVVKEKEMGENRIRVMSLDNGTSHFLKFDDPVFSVDLGKNPEISSDHLRLDYSSLNTPNTVYEYSLASGERILLKQDEVIGDFSPENYQSERIFVKAHDGKQVPVSLVYRKDMFQKNGKSPLFQYAYGSYGHTIEPYFSGARLSLLDRGVVYAIAHIRGGQMLGRSWYDDGKLFNKMNTFTDFIDVTKGLVEKGYGHKNKIYAMGGSAGGLLMGGVLNMAPELYLGVGSHVPFVDVMTTMLDTSIPLTTNEYEQWGNPNVKEYYDYMLSYSPYDQVKRQDYPHMLVTTGFHDSQVQYFEPMKWVAKLRDYKTNDNRLVFETDMEAGHGGASGRFKRFKQIALEYAFFFDLLGFKE